MIAGARYQDTPSIVHAGITSVRSGQTLGYAELSACEKRDYLFESGIRPTAYTNDPGESRPDVIAASFSSAVRRST